MAENEERLRLLAEEMARETEAAGLPWFAGLFNPKIFEGITNRVNTDEKRQEREEDKDGRA